MARQNLKGIPRLKVAYTNSLAGLTETWKNEEAFRLECYLMLFAVPLGLWLGDNAIEKCLLIGSLAMILIVELLNSAIEVAIDRIGLERHELSGLAKDTASAAVLISSLFAGMVWVLILYEHYPLL